MNSLLKTVFLSLINVSEKVYVMAWLLYILKEMLAGVVLIKYLHNINLISECIRRLSFVNIVDVFLLTKILSTNIIVKTTD